MFKICRMSLEKSSHCAPIGSVERLEPLRLAVRARRGHTPRFENLLQLFRFDLPVAVLTARIAPFGQCEKIHGSKKVRFVC